MGLETSAIIALTSVAASAAGGAASFAQARKQDKAKKFAERAASEAMAKAKKRLDVNYLEGTSIAKEAFKLNREATLTAAEQALTAGVESERGSAATAGRVVATQNDAALKTQATMEQSLKDREFQIATEEARLQGLQADIDLGEAEGAQQAASDAATLSAQAATQGVQGFTTAAQTAATDFLPLYGQNKANQFTGAKATTFDNMQEKEFNTLGSANYISPLQMKNQREFDKWKKSLSTDQWNMISSNPSYLDAQPK